MENLHLSQDFEISEMESDIEIAKIVIFLCGKLTIVSQCFSFCWEIHLKRRNFEK